MLGQLIVNGLIMGGIYILIAAGFSIVYTSMRFFNLSHGAIFLTGAYMSLYVKTIFPHLGLGTALVFGSLLATAIHLSIFRLVYFPMRSKGVDTWVLAISSLGVAIAIQAVIGLWFGTKPISIEQKYFPSVFRLGSVHLTSAELIVGSVAFATISLLVLLLNRTKVGKAMRAAVCDREMAEVVGINTQQLDVLVFGIGAFLAALAGALMTLQVPLTHTMDLSALLKAIVVTVLGINKGVFGTFVAGLFLGVVESVTVLKLGLNWKDGIALLILLVYIWVIQIAGSRRTVSTGGL